MVVGTGVMGKGLVERCVQWGLDCHWCYHRNEPEVPATLREHVRVSSFNGLRDNLRAVDLVLCAVAGAAGHVLHAGHAPFFDQEKNVLMVDLGMPRNVAPELARLGGNLRIVDLDGLKHWYRHELAELEPIYALGRQEVRAHKEMYDKLVHDIQGGQPA
jgi:glutamyl-tRNA reductase